MPSLGTAVIAGLGLGQGTGAATARLFAAKGYKVALISRYSTSLDQLAAEIQAAGGTAAAFPIPAYTHTALHAAFEEIEKLWPSSATKKGKEEAGVRFALWNAGSAQWGAFLDISEEQIQDSVQTNIVGAFAFGQESVRAILASTGDAEEAAGHRGSIIFTGATAALRGSNGFGAFAAGKFGIRAISQSVAREYGPKGIHVAHAIIDGSINTPRSKDRASTDPERRAKFEDPRKVIEPDSIAKSYWYLHEQDPSAWTQELDLRPAHEKW